MAKYCLSATAQRNGLQLIAVVLASPSSDERFSDAKRLLDYGFATCGIAKMAAQPLPPVKVTGAKQPAVAVAYDDVSLLVKKGAEGRITSETEMVESLAAPVEKGQKVGTVKYILDGGVIGAADIYAAESLPRVSYADVLGEFFRTMFFKGK